MENHVRKEKGQEITVYSVQKESKQINFRVVEKFKNVFVVERLFIDTITTGFLWWEKDTTKTSWETCDKFGGIIFHGIISNYMFVESYDSLDEAIQWIEDFETYPIYY